MEESLKELLVQPKIKEKVELLKMASAIVWLPKGKWFDFWNGMIYEGDRMIKVYRTLDKMPVFAKAGAIVPLTEKEDKKSGEHREVAIFVGCSNTFLFCEEEEQVQTDYILWWEEEKHFMIKAPKGEKEGISQKRYYDLHFYGVCREAIESVSCAVNGEIQDKEYDKEYVEEENHLILHLSNLGREEEVHVLFKKESDAVKNDIRTRAYEVLKQAQISHDTKERLYQLIESEKSATHRFSEMLALGLPREVLEVMGELLFAQS